MDESASCLLVEIRGVDAVDETARHDRENLIEQASAMVASRSCTTKPPAISGTATSPTRTIFRDRDIRAY